MHSRVCARVSRRLAVGVASILLPALLLGYVGAQALAERSSSLRATCTATTALVRDRLATELTNLESELAIDVGRPAALLGESASARAWLLYVLWTDHSCRCLLVLLNHHSACCASSFHDGLQPPGGLSV